MPAASQFTAAIERHFRKKGQATVSGFRDAAGMSRQAAYQWRDRNAWRLRQVGHDETGAAVWELLGVSPGTTAPPDPASPEAHLRGRWTVAAEGVATTGQAPMAVGTKLIVTGVRLVHVDETGVDQLVLDMRVEGAHDELAVTVS